MTFRGKAYVAGPYTRPDPCVNVHEHVRAADRLVELGFAPFVPVLSHFWHTMSPKGYETWMGLDLTFLPACDVLLRLPGESAGADREVAEARRIGMPVFYSVDELDEHFKNHERPIPPGGPLA